MKTRQWPVLVLGLWLAIGAGTFSACNKSDTEKANDTLKDAGQKTKEALKDAADKAGDALEKAGEKLKEAAAKTNVATITNK